MSADWYLVFMDDAFIRNNEWKNQNNEQISLAVNKSLRNAIFKGKIFEIDFQ